MNDHTFAYAIHIATTPETFWRALTDSEFMQQYWSENVWRIESDWKAGSPVTYFNADGTLYSQGEVLESNPPHSLSYTWPLPPDEQGTAPPERLTWQIAPSDPGTVMLKLVHDRLSEEYVEGVGKGWPKVLSSLKSLLERGAPLTFHPEGAPA